MPDLLILEILQLNSVFSQGHIGIPLTYLFSIIKLLQITQADDENSRIFERWVARTATFNYEYYFDIPDQRTTIQIGVELWKITWLWDTELLDKTYTYNVGTGDDPNPTGSLEVRDGDGDWVSINVSTLGMKRVNTLAVYENGSFYNGHYPALERFTMIILGINETQGPFKEGVNVILVPVSVFLHTQLHAMLESDDPEYKPHELGNESASGIEADFYGLDSDAETVSQYVEGLIIKGLENGDYVTPEEALAILNYVLKNETGAITYSYFVCNESGEVERLGLAKDILDQIPFDAQAMENDDTGPMPKGFWDWLIGVFVAIILFIVLAVLLPFILLGLLIAALVYLGITVLGSIFAAIVLAVIKAIMYVFIFILLAFFLIGILINFVIILVLFAIIGGLGGGTVTPGLLSVSLESNEKTLCWQFSLEWELNSKWDMWVPIAKTSYILNDQEFYSERNNIATGEFQTYTTETVPYQEGTSETEFDLDSFLLGFEMTLVGITVCFVILHFNGFYSLIAYLGLIILLMITSLFLGKEFCLGVAFGFIIASFLMVLGMILAYVIPDKIPAGVLLGVEVGLMILGIISILIGVSGIDPGIFTTFFEVISHPLIVASVFTYSAWLAARATKADITKENAFKIILISCVIFAIVFLIAGILK
ncbi:MAG: hypothetical protein HWN65_15615 [Candidatus Helarchaeota archaeon]|nr:hypothetical protein [Candidatus Helarchaeota archaeon]